MTTPIAHSTSDTARLLLGAPGYAVGWQEPVYIPAPAAGNAWKYTVGGRYYERLIAVTFTFNTSAVVANRFPKLQLLDINNTEVLAIIAGNNVAASSTVNTYLTINNPSLANGSSGATYGFLPDFLVPPGWSWNLSVFALDAGDSVSNIVLLVQRYPNDAAVIPAGM